MAGVYLDRIIKCQRRGLLPPIGAFHYHVLHDDHCSKLRTRGHAACDCDPVITVEIPERGKYRISRGGWLRSVYTIRGNA